MRSSARPLMTPGEGSKPRTYQPDQFSPLKLSPLPGKREEEEDDEKKYFFFAIVNSAFSFTG